jgi:hypothetical protein
MPYPLVGTHLKKPKAKTKTKTKTKKQKKTKKQRQFDHKYFLFVICDLASAALLSPCQHNCSGHGSCIIEQNICHCNRGYGAHDCSFGLIIFSSFKMMSFGDLFCLIIVCHHVNQFVLISAMTEGFVLILYHANALRGGLGPHAKEVGTVEVIALLSHPHSIIWFAASKSGKIDQRQVV